MLKPNFSKQQIKKILEEKVELINEAIINRLRLLGEKCLTEARNGRGYTDQTGNLTSSIGYVIVDHGAIVKTSGFKKPTTASADNTGKKNKTIDGKTGINTGKDLANELAKTASNKGYVLIVVAGMNYASYVESKGSNVLASAELLAERELPGMLRRLKRNTSKTI